MELFGILATTQMSLDTNTFQHMWEDLQQIPPEAVYTFMHLLHERNATLPISFVEYGIESVQKHRTQASQRTLILCLAWLAQSKDPQHIQPCQQLRAAITAAYWDDMGVATNLIFHGEPMVQAAHIARKQYRVDMHFPVDEDTADVPVVPTTQDHARDPQHTPVTITVNRP